MMPESPGALPDPSSGASFRRYRTAADGRHPPADLDTYNRLVAYALRTRAAQGLGDGAEVWVPYAFAQPLQATWEQAGYTVSLDVYDDARQMMLLYFERPTTAAESASPPNP